MPKRDPAQVSDGERVEPANRNVEGLFGSYPSLAEKQSLPMPAVRRDQQKRLKGLSTWCSCHVGHEMAHAL